VSSENSGCTIRIGGFWAVVGLCTAIVGHAIHGSLFWAIMDFFFYPLAWLKWIICQQVNVTIIKGAFSWFLQ